MKLAAAVFIIRMWTERSAGGNSQRGYVEHVASGQRRYFSDLAEALEFMTALGSRRASTEPPAASPEPGPQPSP